MEVEDKFHLPYSKVKNNWEIVSIGKYLVIVRDVYGFTRTITKEAMEKITKAMKK